MILVTLIYFSVMLNFPIDGKIVLTGSGPVRGKLVQDKDVSYYSYQGIPYAENPTGNLRFMPPVPKPPWLQVIDATREGPVCPQSEKPYKKEQMSEDCLYLNIYVPANKTGNPLPVLVYVHGGKVESLSGNVDFIYGPGLLMQRDIIFVTMNYRLGALGFLSLDIKEATGNAGIKDILLALKWIKANVIRFGGDPSKITLGGNSAGAVLAHYLVLSNKSTGLFQQAILISGSALGYRFLARHPKDVALALADELRLEACDTNDLLQKLKNINASAIVDAQEKMGEGSPRNIITPFAPFVPCIEIENESAILTKDPIEIIKSGIPQNVPILAGFNAQEGIKMLPPLWKNKTRLDELNQNFELCIPSDIEYPYGSQESIELANSIRNVYFDGADISNETLDNFVDFISESHFSYSVDLWIKLHKQNVSSNDLYYYVFSFDGELNWFKLSNNVDFPGTAHADELGYIFVTRVTKPKLETVDTKSLRMQNKMVTYLSNFVKYGNPTPVDQDSDVIWPDCGQDRSHLLLSEPSESRDSAPLEYLLDFWYNIYDHYYDYVKSGGQLQKKIIP